MPFQLAPRLPPVPASMLAAVCMLAMAGCSGQITPLGPDAPPQPHHLAAPLVLQAVRVVPGTSASGCPAGSAAPTEGPAQCYRKLGAPLRITSAAVAAATLTPAQMSNPPGQAAGAPSYAFVVAPPASDAGALSTVTTAAADAHGNLALSVAGRTWLLPRVVRPFSHQFQIIPPNGSQARWLRRILMPSR